MADPSVWLASGLRGSLRGQVGAARFSGRLVAVDGDALTATIEADGRGWVVGISRPAHLDEAVSMLHEQVEVVVAAVDGVSRLVWMRRASDPRPRPSPEECDRLLRLRWSTTLAMLEADERREREVSRG